MSDFRGLIVAVSGPSGVGKGTVLARVEELLEQANPGSVGHSISVTTRAPRGQEKDGPKFSIITVTYNAGKVLEDTIQSVVLQTYRNVEYIIVDGNSKDNTLEIVEKYRDRIHFSTCIRTYRT